MAGSAHRWMKGALLAFGAALAAHAQAPAQAQTQAWRCGAHTYSQAPCAGGRPVGAKPKRVTDKAKAPPQDRAVAAKRASLTPEDRQECRALDGQLREQEKALRARGEAATLDDEMPLVRSKKRFRELRC